MLSTPWSRDFGLRVPIVNAPMGGVAGGRLAAAVSAAGGLGMIGMGSTATRESLAAELQQVSGRFGIGLVDWVMRRQAGLLDDALAAAPSLLSVSFGTDWTWVRHAHEAGITTVTQVYDADGARRAADAGIDIVVARGAEGGGHGEVRLATLPLLDAVLDAVSVPVLAGGGVASARSLAAVLAAGAAGAWVGTRLAACPEALSGETNRRALIDAAGTDTRVTRDFDIAAGLPWPERFPSRVLTREVAGAPVDAGQGVGMVRDAATVGEVIEEMCSGAQRLLARWAHTLAPRSSASAADPAARPARTGSAPRPAR